MGLNAAGEVIGDAGVEGRVAALDYIGVPGHGEFFVSKDGVAEGI